MNNRFNNSYSQPQAIVSKQTPKNGISTTTSTAPPVKHGRKSPTKKLPRNSKTTAISRSVTSVAVKPNSPNYFPIIRSIPSTTSPSTQKYKPVTSPMYLSQMQPSMSPSFLYPSWV